MSGLATTRLVVASWFLDPDSCLAGNYGNSQQAWVRAVRNPKTSSLKLMTVNRGICITSWTYRYRQQSKYMQSVTAFKHGLDEEFFM